ncbi:hypothetical protein [Marinobacter zhanjiangensis]|uniref:Uncharacterized protein n=1 Tax=Marinobacter zhanjiangensis TaxID=578215 RepID=A0ABQ3AWK7_9GAMM|nr:hypothetical protein [Marinobacter zhanjiangensis]GGY68789.1 hypothetical protein GCM10007071_14560 [Marinobacter zhanjiangensis]
MSITNVLCYLCLPISLWAAFVMSWLTQSQESLAVDVAMVAGSFSVITSPFWIIYIMYLAIKLIPPLDALTSTGQASDRYYAGNWMARLTRLNIYSANLVSARARKMYNLPVDLRLQPAALRLALRVYVYWMILVVSGGVAGFVLFEVAR